MGVGGKREELIYFNEEVIWTLISSLSSIQLQLHNRITIGNCCSNFHLVIKDLLSVGCGIASLSSSSSSSLFDDTNHELNIDHNTNRIGYDTFTCLQDHINPKYHICCSWDQSDRCRHRRNPNMTTTILSSMT